MCAFAFLNFATYILWWNKPLNVSRPVLVYRNHRGKAETNEGTEAGSEGGMTTEDRVKEGCGQSVKRMWKAFIRGLVDIRKEVYRVIDGAIKETGSAWVLPLSLFYPILDGTSFASDQRVGTFGPDTANDGDVKMWSVLTSGAVGIIYGSIHCTAWRFQFPSYIEQLLWRISAISVTGGPLLMGLFTVLGVYVDSMNTPSTVAFILVFILYIIARLALLVLSFTTLRSLPPGAFRAVDWARFIPHFA